MAKKIIITLAVIVAAALGILYARGLLSVHQGLAPPPSLAALTLEKSPQTAPDVAFTDAAGTRHALSTFRGRYVLLNLWATWCAPCVVEMPLLDKLAEDMAGKLTVVTVSEDFKPELVPPFLAEKGFKALPQWVDPGNKLALDYGGASLPLTVLYDKNGKEVWRIIGGYDWGSAKARQAVADGRRERRP